MTPRRTIETRAAEVLDMAGVTTAPILVEKVATHLGAVIRYQPFEHDVSGMLFRSESGPPIIGVNSANAQVRQRFTIAHELGHLLLHKGRRLILDRLVRINFRDATSSTATDTQEIEANAFAAALLLPQPLLRERLHWHLEDVQITDEQLVERLAKDFRVSRQAMEFRLVNLGLLTPG
jgi:Zn-dependent peptidase ImmA (M78 family)